MMNPLPGETQKRFLKATIWEKMGDHPAVWQDYISSCGGDTNIDRYYVDKDTEVKRGYIIFDMDDGSVVVEST